MCPNRAPTEAPEPLTVPGLLSMQLLPFGCPAPLFWLPDRCRMRRSSRPGAPERAQDGAGAGRRTQGPGQSREATGPTVVLLEGGGPLLCPAPSGSTQGAGLQIYAFRRHLVRYTRADPRPGSCRRAAVLLIRSTMERATSIPARCRCRRSHTQEPRSGPRRTPERAEGPGPQLRAGTHQGQPRPCWRTAGRSPVPLHQVAPRARSSSSTPSGDIWYGKNGNIRCGGVFFYYADREDEHSKNPHPPQSQRAPRAISRGFYYFFIFFFIR